MSYMNRALKSKDPRFAQVLGKLGYERRDMVSSELGDDTPPKGADSSDELVELRAEYQRVLQKRPYHGWDEATLREKIDEASDSGE